jgi:dienelactone hydrolase
VLWQTPLGAPPPSGWPLAVVYQGSLMSPNGQLALSSDGMWVARAVDAVPYGLFAANILQELHTQTGVIRALLDGGYAVITPSADAGGLAWDTNVPPWDLDWAPAPDNQFLDHLFAAVDAGAFGPIDPARWYATGVSSGGYMTSRMAVSYAGRFRALAIAAGSYATCGGPACIVPLTLPPNHPPTLFLHGALDTIVPVVTMYAYRDTLSAAGHEVKTVVDPLAEHGWIAACPTEIAAWFDAH